MRFLLIFLIGLAIGAPSARANLVTNGDFSGLAAGVTSPGAHICANGSSVGSTCTSNITGWSATCSSNGCAGTNSPGSILLSGSSGSGWNGNIGLYGTINNPPAGGNTVAIDGDSAYTQTLSQTISGLTIGDIYTLSFYQAAAQQANKSGATTERWSVTLGSSPTQLSTLINNPSHGYVDWAKQSLTFTATSASELLSFLAVGTPNNEPPVVLLSDVSLNLAPEPISLSVLGIGLAGLAAVRRRRAKA